MRLSKFRPTSYVSRSRALRRLSWSLVQDMCHNGRERKREATNECSSILASLRLCQPHNSLCLASNYAEFGFSTNLECHCRLKTEAIRGTGRSGLVANMVAFFCYQFQARLCNVSVCRFLRASNDWRPTQASESLPNSESSWCLDLARLPSICGSWCSLWDRMCWEAIGRGGRKVLQMCMWLHKDNNE